ncbi:hypothetical protein L228DRAFT_265493 [Xylona heveae TC161]|uniref:Uncharacterized protein n=1 Tax=Xylona heveae (strain CBS 132557 / TC161) TaxID=1328760 RepID=A0A165IJZ4_XYLHT|nr:hypothetical protein L228DRAFT_265493 [Xylona heveae TC161]KZF25001.1 hypothetical protein L228DRAFT_265493 [Xylona heveae TC161]
MWNLSRPPDPLAAELPASSDVPSNGLWVDPAINCRLMDNPIDNRPRDMVPSTVPISKHDMAGPFSQSPCLVADKEGSTIEVYVLSGLSRPTYHIWTHQQPQLPTRDIYRSRSIALMRPSTAENPSSLSNDVECLLDARTIALQARFAQLIDAPFHNKYLHKLESDEPVTWLNLHHERRLRHTFANYKSYQECSLCCRTKSRQHQGAQSPTCLGNQQGDLFSLEMVEWASLELGTVVPFSGSNVEHCDVSVHLIRPSLPDSDCSLQDMQDPRKSSAHATLAKTRSRSLWEQEVAKIMGRWLSNAFPQRFLRAAEPPYYQCYPRLSDPPIETHAFFQRTVTTTTTNTI